MAKTELRIKDILRSKGMTQIDLANKLGISPVALNRAMGRNKFDLDYLSNIADALGCTIPDLFAEGNSGITLNCPHCGKAVTLTLK